MHAGRVAALALVVLAGAPGLPTAYVPPPGDALEHHASGFTKVLCSAVFITGLDPDFAAENVGFFTSPPAERAKLAGRRAKAFCDISDNSLAIQNSCREQEYTLLAGFFSAFCLKVF